jgi:predicted amidohydrolase YtcJ
LDLGRKDRIYALADRHTNILNLDGRSMLPGFIDAHSHFLHAGLYDLFLVNLKSPPLGEIVRIGDLVTNLRQVASATPKAQWIIGYGYDDTLLEEKRHPLAQDLNQASLNHPILIRHVSGHVAVLNSPALSLCGIDRQTKDPEGARIPRDSRTGVPNGILDGEPAIKLVEHVLPSWQPDDWLKAVARSSRMYAARGVTTAQEGDAQPGDLSRLVAGHEQGKLGIRVQLYPNWEHPLELDIYPATKCGTPITTDQMLTVGGVKLYQDGSIQAYSGYLSQPYHRFLYPQLHGDQHRGWPRNSTEQLDVNVETAHRQGWQVAVHANGDQAIQDVIDAIEKAQRYFPRPDPRHIIIHCQTVRDDQLDRMNAIGIVPSFFTTHTYFWGDRHWDIFLGPHRTRRLNPCRSAMDRRMPFTCHNDTYVTPIDPLLSIWSAVNRISAGGRVIGEEFCVPVMEALRSVTCHAAYQNHEEQIKGTLAPGKLADMTLLEDNPLEIDPIKIKGIQISATIVGGQIVYGSI